MAGALVLPVVILGKIEASTIRRFLPTHLDARSEYQKYAASLLRVAFVLIVEMHCIDLRS